MNRTGWAEMLRGLFRRPTRRLRSRLLARRQVAGHRVESLEQRRLLAVDFVSVSVMDGEPLYTAQLDQGLVPFAGTLTESPQQVTLRFTPGTEIDPESLGGISIVRSGRRGDGFEGDGSLQDIPVQPGVLVVDDLPARNQVVIRFAETLPDDTYRFTISSTIDRDAGTIGGLRTLDGQAFRGGGSFSFDVNITLGPQVVAVVPQPITRDADNLTAGLAQGRNTIEVYFNAAEQLNAASAESVGFYKLIEIDDANGEDVSESQRSPLRVSYDAASHRAVLEFAEGDLNDDRLYRLEIGGSGILADPQIIPGIVGDAGSSYATALPTGVIDEAGLVVSAAIEAEGSVSQPGSLPNLLYPDQPGSVDELGHRNVPIDNSTHGLTETGYATVAPAGTQIETIPFNFQTHYGDNTQGSPLSNLITAEQKLRAREVFDLFSRYAGVRFVETAAEGITVAVGSTLVISDNSPVNSLEGLARGAIVDGVPTPDALAVINSGRDWGESEYGGAFFRAAMRQIGGVLGLWQSYDVPSVMGESLPGEQIFPSDNDLVHLQQLFPRSGTDIDLYSFSLAEAGSLTAETIAARRAGDASMLDTVVSVFGESYDTTATVAGVSTTVVGQTVVAAGSSATVAGVNVAITGVGARVAGGETKVVGTSLTVTGTETQVVGLNERITSVAARVQGAEAVVQALPTRAVGSRASITAVAERVAQAVASSTTVFLEDVSAIAVGADVIGLTGVPLDTTVEAIDTLAKSVVLSNPVTVAAESLLGFSLTDGVAVAASHFFVSDSSAVSVHAPVKLASGAGTTDFENADETVPTGTRVNAVEPGGIVEFSQPITVKLGDELGFGSTTAQVALDDVSNIPVGSRLGISTGDVAVDSARPLVVAVNRVAGVVTLSAPQTVAPGDLLAFDFNPADSEQLTAPVTARRFLVSGLTDSIVAGLPASSFQGIAANTTVESVDTDMGIVVFSRPVVLEVGATVGFGFTGTTVQLDDITAVKVGAVVEGPGIPADTTVSGVDAAAGFVTLSASVSVADGQNLGFSIPAGQLVTTNRIVVEQGGRTLTVGSPVSDASGADLGLTVQRVEGRVVTLDGAVDLDETSNLLFGSDGRVFHVGDTSGIQIGGLVTAANGVAEGVVVTSVDAATGRIMVSGDVILSHGDDVQFGVSGTSVVVGYDASVVVGVPVTSSVGVPEGTVINRVVVNRDGSNQPISLTLTLSNRVSLPVGSTIKTGFVGDTIVVADLAGVEIGGLVTAEAGVDAGTRVLSMTSAAAGSGGTVTLDRAVAVEDGLVLGFGRQAAKLLLNSSAYDGTLVGSAVTVNGMATDVTVAGIVGNELTVQGGTGTLDVAHDDVIGFSFAGSLATKQVIVADTTGLTVGGALDGASGTTITAVDRASGLVALSAVESVTNNASLRFGFSGSEITLDTIAAIDVGTPLTGAGLPDGVYVTAVNPVTKQVSLSKPVTVANGTTLDVGYGGNTVELPSVPSWVAPKTPISGPGIRPGTLVESVSGNMVILNQRVQVASGSPVGFGSTTITVADIAGITVGAGVTGLPGQASGAVTVTAVDPTTNTVTLSANVIVPHDAVLEFGAVATNTITLADVAGLVVGTAVSGLGVPAGVTITGIDPATSTVTLSENVTVSSGAVLGLGTPRRELIARNNDAFGRDSFLKIDLEAGNYYVAVTSVGNTEFNPAVPDSGANGRTQGAYDLSLKFQPTAGAARTIVDASGTPLDGDRDGQAGGTFNFWFRTAAEANTLYVDKLSFDAATTVTVAATRSTTITVANTADITRGMELVGDGIPAGTTVENVVDGTTLNLSDPVTVKAGGMLHIADSGSGTLAEPYRTIAAAIAAAQTDPSKTIIRVAGNSGDELSGLRIAGTARSLRPNALESDINPHHYYIGIGEAGNELADGGSLIVPAGVTLMVDAGAVLRMRQANIDVGSSTELVSRSAAALQLLGVPNRPIRVTSAMQGAALNGPSAGPVPEGGDWGGIVLRADSDWQPDPGETLAHDTLRPFLNTINHAVIEYAGGRVQVDSELREFSAIQLEDARPSLGFNQILRSASNAISATPNSFLEAGGRAGPQLSGNVLELNSTNGLFINIRTEYGVPLDTLDVAARFASTEVTYVLQESLILAGGAGSYFRDSSGRVQPRAAGRLTIDPGVVVKLQNSRIELERGAAQLLAEGTPSQPVVFTNFSDVRFGAGGTFDTNGDLPNGYGPGSWGGIILNAGSQASIDHAFVSGGGGEVPIEGVFDSFNVIEVHQGDLRLANSRLQSNSSGVALTDRTARGSNEAATVFIRGAQPVIVGNDFRDNAGATISINANAMTDVQLADPGRQTGQISRAFRFDDNIGPLIRDNRISYATTEPIVVGYDEPALPPLAELPTDGSVQRIDWNGQKVDVLTNSWVVRASTDNVGPISFAAGWSAVDIGAGYYELKAPGASVSDVVAWAAGDATVAYVEPNFLLRNQRVASDPQFDELWGLNNTGQNGGLADADIDAPEAWDITTGSNEVVIAVIDTGVDYTHEDLAANIWVNPGEIPGDGIDNDGNGFIDDVRGWDFANEDNDPMDVDGHGTHVAGTIGAVANNGIGITGVSWNVKILPVKFLDPFGSTVDAIESVMYLTELRQQGINIVASNNSWGGGAYSQALLDVIDAGGEAGILFVAAAGNAANNNDANPHYPSNYQSTAVLSVAATDRNNNLAGFSNFGATSVDIGAPGVDILSTLPGNAYGVYSGTSMAAPHATGVAALLAAANPEATMEEIRDAILNGAVPIPSLTNNVATGALLNASGALAAFRGVSRTAGVVIRGEEIVVDSVWDDTDIVHVLQDEIIVNNLHTATSLKLLSQANASLVVKLAGPNAGFTASGELTDIDDRVGGTVQVIGQPGFPVVLTSLFDDSVGASLDAYGFPVTDTNVDGSISQPSPGDWRSLQFLPLSNDRNVGTVQELEPTYTDPYIDENNSTGDAEFLGTLAPNYASDGDTWESAQEKTGDENRRLGFDVSGTIAFNDPTDVDVYSFDGYAGSEVWVEIDQTSSSLDSMVEVLDASGRVLARSANSQADTGSVTGVVVAADPGGTAVVTGAEAAVIGAAAAVTGVGAQVDGIDVTVTGVAARATGYQAQVIGIGAQALLAASAGDTSLTLDDATGVRIGATPTLAGVIPVGARVVGVNGNTITLDQPLDAQLNAGDWIAFNISGIDAFSSSRIIFDVPPTVGAWVGDELYGNTVQSVEGVDSNIVVLGQAIGVVPDYQFVTRSQRFNGGGWPYSENGVPNDADHGIQTGNDPFYRLLKSSGGDDGNRNISFANIVPALWEELTIQAEMRFTAIGTTAPADGHGFRLQDSSAPVDNSNPEGGSNPAVNMLSIHFDLFDNGAANGDAPVPHMSISWGSRTDTFSFTNISGQWRDVQISIARHPAGAALTVSLDQSIIVEDYVLAGYSTGRSTTFIAGARSGSAGDGDHDVDDISVTSKVPRFASTTEVALGLSLTTTNTRVLSLDNVTPIEIASTVNNTATAVTSVELAAGTEPNNILAAATPVAITVVPGSGSQFQATGTVGDGTYGDRDVDFYRLDVPITARGSLVTIDGSTQGVNPDTAIGDIYLRVFNASGNVVAFNDDGGPGFDSSLTFTVPQSYDGSGYFVGVSGFNNSSYSPTVAGSGVSGSTGDYILRGSFSAAFTVVPAGEDATAGVVTFNNPISVSDDQLLTFSLAAGQTVQTRYITVSDASQVPFGAQVTGVAGIPDGTIVISRDLANQTLELSNPITISRDDMLGIGFTTNAITVTDTSALTVGMAVSGSGVLANTVVQFINPVNNSLSLNQPVNVVDGQYLTFGFVGVPVTTDTLYVDDTAVTIGAIVEAASNPGVALATVSAIDPETSAVTLNQPVTVDSGKLLIFGLNGQAITARRVVVDNAGGVLATVPVNEVGVSALDQDVPDGTTVVNVEPVIGSGILELSGAVTVRTGDSLGFGFAGYDVVLDDVTGVALSETVGGSGVPVGTTVTGVNGNTVTLSAPVSVEDAAPLTFTGQEFSLLPSAEAPAAVSVLPGSLTGVVYDGNTAIQTFTAHRNGTLLFMPVGNPPAQATSGTVDYVTGKVSLTFDNSPRQAIRLEADFDYSTLSLATLGFDGTGNYGAYPLMKDAWRGGDFYTTNPRDAGMRLTLPGTQGTKQKYFIRVRSQPAAGADQSSYEANLVQASPLADGQTSGNYDLSVRLRQRDEAPGSTVRYADIRYPMIGIDVLGLPNNSPLVGTSGERPDDNNDTFQTAQPLGNLLTADRNTISVAGEISDEGDIDWYTFTLSYEDIQSLFGHNDGAKTWSTVFDIDYADGFRGDLTLSVFDSTGALIYIGRDSNVADDQPGPGQEGGDFDDLSRGSVGNLDPFIGPAHLPAGTDGAAGPRTYYVAVSSNERLPTILDQTFTAAATNSNVRLEPVTSIARVVEDHIWPAGGYLTLDPVAGASVPRTRVESQSIFADVYDEVGLSVNIRPYTLSDVVLYVSTNGSIEAVNPFTGQSLRGLANFNGGLVGDIDMRTDGSLFQYFGANNDPQNNGLLREVSWVDGSVVSSAGDGISDDPVGGPTAWQISGQSVDAFVIRRTGAAGTIPQYGTNNFDSGIYYSVRDGGQSVLYWARPNGNAGFVQNQPNGRVGLITGSGVSGNTTGLQFQNDSGTTLYGVSSGGQFFTVDRSTGAATAVVDFSSITDPVSGLTIAQQGGFQGLANAPVNLEGGRYQGWFFAITGSGRLVVINPTAAGGAKLVENIFDTNADGVADSYMSLPTAGSTGLAFSPLDVNPWHPTTRRRDDEGHAVNAVPDDSRYAFGREVLDGSRSFYFGIEQGPRTTVTDYIPYGGVQYGVEFSTWQTDVTSRTDIGDNYNLPGGAQGSLVSSSFSLDGYSAADKPTLYFNYFLETEDRSTDEFGEFMLDSARVFASRDGGVTWELLATNNSDRSATEEWDYQSELPPVASVSSGISDAGYNYGGVVRVPNQRVQELFDVAQWRQARVDLADFAGEAEIYLRFDFSTAGEMDAVDNSTATPVATKTVDGVVTASRTVGLDSTVGVSVGMVVNLGDDQFLASGDDMQSATVVGVDADAGRIELDSVVNLSHGALLHFFNPNQLKNLAEGFAGTIGSGNLTGPDDSSRFTANNFEGFYIDNIIVGFAERGEIVSGATVNATDFFNLGTPIDNEYPNQSLAGQYQLEIRRGTEYASEPYQTSTSTVPRRIDGGLAINAQFDTNARFVTGEGDGVLQLAASSLSVVDGVTITHAGDGSFDASGNGVLLTAGGGIRSNQNLLGWNVDLEGVPSAVLNFTSAADEVELTQVIPETFRVGPGVRLVPVDSLSTGSPWAMNMQLGATDDYAFVGVRGELQIYDIATDPSSPALVGSVAIGRSWEVSISPSGDYAYVADDSGAGVGGLVIVDIRDKQSPMVVSRVAAAGGNSWGVTVSPDGNTVYLGDANAGVQIIDVSDPTNPKRKAIFNDFGGTYYSGNVVLSEDGTRLFVANGWGGVQILDVSTPENPVLIGSISNGNRGWSWSSIYVWHRMVTLSPDEQTLFIAQDDDGIAAVDISDPSNPVTIWQRSTADMAKDVALSPNGDELYVTTRSGGLVVYDVSSIQTPLVVSGGATRGDSESIAITSNGANVYVTTTSGFLETFERSVGGRTDLPSGDGVAVSLDGGVNWQRVAMIEGQGQQSVDLIKAVGPMTADTVIGFFQGGTSEVTGIRISDISVTTDFPQQVIGTIGDSNNTYEFEQGQFIVESNLITNAASYGVRIDSARSDVVDPYGNYVGITNEPDFGVARNLPVLNNPRLVPGAVVSNNVIAGAGTAGVVFSGTANTQDQPQSVVPFGRIVNNTIYGGEGSSAVGIDVSEQAGPTILNNVFAELAVGVRVDASSRVDGQGNERTVVSASAFHAVGLEVAGVEQRLGQTLGGSPFVNAAGGNFYPVPGTAVVDSSLSAVQDRNEYRVVTESIGLAAMPIVAPIRDVYGQLRTDDPNQANVPGLGGTVFQDRGAVERVDQERPVGRIVAPLDQGSNPTDTDLTLDSVVVEGPDARGIGTMAIQLTDLGVGIDKRTVTSDAFVLTRDGIRLLDTIDYRWIYNENTDQVLFQATSVFSLGEYLITIDSVAADPTAGIVGRVTDRANNPIRRNVGGDTLAPATFSIRLLDVPGVPSRVVAAAGDGTATLGWIAPYSPPSIPVTRYDVQYSTRTRLKNDDTDWTDWTPSIGGTINASPVEVDWPNNEDRVYRIRAVNVIGLGRWSDVASATPSAPSVTTTTPGKNSVTLHWTTPVNNGGRSIERYVIQRSVDEGATWIDVLESATGTTATVFGLPKGQPQRFKVAAVTAVGRGEWSNETADIEPQGVPDAPTALTSEIDLTDGSVILSWTAPENTGGVTISGYELSYELADESGTPVTIPGIASPNYDLAGLQRGTDYIITVAAVNVHGSSDLSQSVVVTTPDVIQNAPSVTAVVSGFGSVEVSWRSLSVPAVDLPLTDYVVQSKPESAPETDWATSATVPVEDGTSYTVTGLTRADGPYRFRVAARNTLAGVAVNDLTFSNESAAVTPIEISGVVENLTAVPGNEQVVLAWEPPLDDGGGQLIDYRVEVKESEKTEWSPRADGVTATPGVTVTELVNGKNYDFRVIPVTQADTGEEFDGKAAETSDMPFGPPTEPTNLVATAGVEQVTLNWGLPASSGGRKVTHYVVEYAKETTGPWTVVTDFTDDQDAADFTATVPDPVNQEPDLVKGTKYFFRVMAVNAAGNGPVSAVVSATPTGLPDEPVSFAFTPDQADGSLQVTWAAPLNTGALPVTYELQYRQVGEDLWTEFNDATPSDRSSDLPGLSRGADYDVRVRAKNDVGYSRLWLNGSFTAPDVPAAPTGLVASLPSPDAIGVVELTWVAPAPGNNVLPVTDYVIQQSTNDGVAWQTLADGVGTTTSYTVSELLRTDGGHIFRVAAKNILPGVTDLNVLNFTPATAPVIPLASSEAVDNLDVNPGDQQVTLTWSAPADSGGVTVTNYRVEQNDGSGSGWQVVGAGTSTVLSRTVTGLTNGTSYQFRVTPQTSLGDGLAATSQAAVPFGLPTAPANLQVSGGVKKLTASWDAATGNGRVITDYVMEYRLGSNGDWVTYVDGPGTNLTATLVAPTLPTGVDLYVRVAAVNERGTGPFTAAVGPVIATDVPNAPTAVVASVNSNGSIGLTWTAPASDGGSTITDYVVQYRQTASSVWVTYADGMSTASSAVVSGLERLSGPYSFRVLAKNAVGTSAASTESNSVTPLAVPGPILELVPTARDRQILVNWEIPADNGGAAVIDYEIEYQTLGNEEWLALDKGRSTQTTAVIDNLVNGTEYRVRLRAVNVVGAGDEWVSGSAVPFGLPTAPANLQVSGGVGKLTASWDAATGNGRVVTDYVIQYRQGLSGNWETYDDGTNTNLAATLVAPALPTGVNLYVRVAAVNEGGTDPVTAEAGPVIATAVPNAPTAVVASVRNNGSIGLTWTAPASDGGSAITDYVVQYRQTASSAWLTYADGMSTASSVVVTGLERLTGPYSFRVLAKNAVGTSAASTESNSVTPLAVPGGVQSLIATPGNGQVQVSWQTPADNGGAVLTDYLIEYKQLSAVEWTPYWDGIDTERSATITELQNGVSYIVRVRAVNSVGQGAWVSSAAIMPVTEPGVPTALAISVDSGQASLSWAAPAGGGLPLNDYIVQYRLASASDWITWNDGITAIPAVTITSLTNGLHYVFRVKATTTAFPHDPANPGDGNWVVSESRVIGPKAVAPPVAAAQKYGNGIFLTWNRITPPVGFSVLSYQVEYYDSAAGKWQVAGQADPRANSLLVDGTNLDRGTYTLRVAAVTNVGVGHYRVSNPVTF